MDHACYRCGNQVEAQAPFCAACGAPQIRVSTRQEAESSPAQAPAPPPPASPVLHGSDASLRPSLAGQIEWGRFFRIALPLATLVGFFALAMPPLAWLILLPGSVLLAAHLYGRRRPGPLTTLQGAKLGAFTSVLSFAFFSILLVTFIAINPDQYRQMMQGALAKNPSPEAQQLAQGLSSGASEMVLLTAVIALITLVILLIIGTITGALAVTVVRKRSNP